MHGAIESKCAVERGLVLEIDYGGGIDGNAHETGFEMEVRTGRAACVTAESYRVTGFHAVVGLCNEFGEVSVYGLHTVVVADHDVVAIASTLITTDAYFAVESGPYSIAYMETEINAFVNATESRTIAEIGGNADIFKRADIRTYIKFLGVGDSCAGVRIDKLTFPVFAEHFVIKYVIGT